MRKYLWGLWGITLIICVACGTGRPSTSWMSSNGKIKVLSTTAMIDDVVRQIGGDHVDTTILIKGELDPHSYQLVKGDDEKLAFADIIFYNGLGLEHGATLHAYLEKSNKAIGLGNNIQAKDPALILSYNGQIDPHIWTDISMWERILPFIVQTLAQKAPQHTEFFQANADKVREEMVKLHQDIRREMLDIPQHQRYLVSSHDAFNYFTRAYLAEESELLNNKWQKRFAAPEGLAPESQLSAAEIQYIIDHLAKYQIHMLFPESNVSKDSIRKIVEAGKEKGLHLKMATDPLYADAMGKPGSEGDSYLKMIKYNADIIAHYLRKNYP